MVLVDVSGSMRNNLGVGFVKLAVKDNLLRPLDSIAGGVVRVAVAPFGSIQVEPRIQAARFVRPRDAVDDVEALPPPERENTALYSAIRFGVRRLEQELAEAGGDPLGVLVVITDGDNDVGGREDDPGLLDGQAGLQEATRALSQSRVVPWIIGIGERVSGGPLRTMAGTKGRSYSVPIDAYRLARPLEDTRDLLATTWEIAFPVPAGGREELGRGWLAVGLRHLRGSGGDVATAIWRPPVIALPAFSGVASSGVIPPALVQGGVGSGLLDRRVPLLLFVLVLLVLLWLVAPRLLWPRVTPAGATPTAAAPKKAVRASGGIRTDVKEAPPRRPADVTASKARAAG
jgi:hypothetical protein